MSAAEESRGGGVAKLGSAALLGGMTVASLVRGAPSVRTLGQVFAGTAACVSPGLYDAHLAVSYGYGASLVWQAVLFARHATRTPAQLLLIAYTLYGLKVCAFQLARDLQPAYVAKALAESRERSPRGLTAARLPLVLSISSLLSAFAFPLHAAARAPGALGVGVGALVALGGLLVQTVADVQKFLHKRREGADSLCRTGLWQWSRHPNYLGEIYFQGGVAIAGLCGAWAVRSPATALLASLAPAAFVAIMLGATARLEERQLQTFGDEGLYRQWVMATPRLFFSLRRRRIVAADDAKGDTAAEEVLRREEQDLLATGITNIVAVTGAAGVSTGILGTIGWWAMMVLPGL